MRAHGVRGIADQHDPTAERPPQLHMSVTGDAEIVEASKMLDDLGGRRQKIDDTVAPAIEPGRADRVDMIQTNAPEEVAATTAKREQADQLTTAVDGLLQPAAHA